MKRIIYKIIWSKNGGDAIKEILEYPKVDAMYALPLQPMHGKLNQITINVDLNYN